jgi:hypothetical protein
MMESLINLILGEVAVALILIILLLLIIIWQLLRKHVAVPSITVSLDKTSYLRGETVQISGVLKENDEPQPGQTVPLEAIDPSGAQTSLPEVVTDADGKFASTFAVPPDAVGGSWKIMAGPALGVTDTATFTLSNKK